MKMVLSIYRRFFKSTNFCSKERLLRPVAMMLGYVKNRQPVQFHSHPGQSDHEFSSSLDQPLDLLTVNKRLAARVPASHTEVLPSI